jgi:elongation factor P|tara:strand:+ start:4304 stop:4864 length:561 start_codon:yes stop_codon:yes gene_type:complete
MKISGNEVKTGMIIEHNNDLWEVLKTQHVKPGKGGAFNQVEMKSINKETKLNERFRSSDSVERAIVEEIDYNFLYEDKGEYYFINNKTFEQINLKKKLLGEKSKFLSEGLEVKIEVYNDLPIKIDLPNQIECKIETTDAAIKGQTAASSYKPALLENGVNVQVPPFIESGDIVIVDTRTIEYVKKI